MPTRLSPDLIAALGTAPDADIAARFGTTASAVRQARMSRDIPAYTAVRERDIEAALAAHPERSLRAVARDLGVAVTTVIRAAERLREGTGRSQVSLAERRASARPPVPARLPVPPAAPVAERVYVTPTMQYEILRMLREAGTAQAFVDIVRDAPRHRMQHRVGVPLTGPVADALRALLPGQVGAWDAARATATGRGAEGRSALTRMIEEGRDVLAALGVSAPVIAAPAIFRVTPRLRDVLEGRPLPPAVEQAVADAAYQAESHKWEVVLPVAGVGAFMATLADVRRDVDARHAGAQGVEKSALGWLRRELSALSERPEGTVIESSRGKVVAAPVSSHTLRGARAGKV